MKTMKVLSVMIAALCILISIWSPIAAARSLPPKDSPADDDQVRAESKGAEVRTFFRGSVLTPSKPTGNSSAETKACAGKAYGARMFGVPCGTWKMTVNGDTIVSGPASVTIWARSQAGAKNAGFRVNMMRNGDTGNSQALFTNRQTLGAEPVKLSATGTFNMQFTSGDTFDVQLVWLSDPQHVFGPAGSGEFLYGNAQYDSNVKIAFQSHPISITNITAPVIALAATTIKAEFRDILGADPSTMVYSLSVSGATTATPANLGAPSPSGGTGNTSSVTWTWNAKLDNAKSGQYTITVAISYDGNATTTNSTALTITFPVKPGGSGGGIFSLKGGNFPYMLTIVIVLVVVIVVIVIAVVLRGKKKGKKKKPAEEDEEDEEEEEEKEEEEED
jgi:hypothetical protein